jgi:hypothetical protein
MAMDTLVRVRDRFRPRDLQEEEERRRKGAARRDPSAWRWRRDAVDIDPTLMLRSSSARDTSAWWCPREYPGLRTAKRAAWLANVDDPPRPTDLVQHTDAHGSTWVAVQFGRIWRSGDDEPGPRRSYWLAGRAYIVRASDLELVDEWARSREGWGWSVWTHALEPSSAIASDVMFREYWASEAFYTAFDQPFGDELPARMIPTARSYIAESGTDLSMGDTVHLWLPHEWLVDRLALRHGARDGDYVDESGTVVMREPTAREVGPSALLMRTDAVERLRAEGYELLWLVLGEKLGSPWHDGSSIDSMELATFSGTLHWHDGKWVDSLARPTTQHDIVRAAASASDTLLTAEGLGVTPGAMSRMEMEGVVERVVPGVYIGAHQKSPLTPAAGWCLRRPDAVVGLLTAASHYGYVDAHPRGTWLFVPKGTSPPRSKTAPVQVLQTMHYIDPAEDQETGIERPIVHGVKVRMTGRDRTVLDLWRHRRRISIEHAHAALRRHVAHRSFDLARFRALAERLGVWNKLATAVGALLP